MTSNFYLNCRSVSEVFRWYLTEERMNSLPPISSYNHGGTVDTDILAFAGNLSFEICRVGEQWSCLLRRARYSSLILLLGAGGVVVYLLKKGNRGRTQRGSPTSPPVERRRKPRFEARSFWSWLVDGELVEDFSEDSYFLHSHYFGPSLSAQSNLPSVSCSGHESELMDSEAEDVSLNSLNLHTSPKRFLKRPLFDIRNRSRRSSRSRAMSAQQYSHNTSIHISNPCPKCVKGTCRLKKHQMYLNPACSSSSSGSSNYSGSPQYRLNHQQKTSTPECDAATVDDHLHGFFRPGYDERMSGDGSDEMDAPSLNYQMNKLNRTPVGFLKDQYRPTYRLYGRSRGTPDGKERYSMSPVQHNSRCSSPGPSEVFQDSDPDHASSLYQDNPSMSACSMSGSMLDLVENAREVRRLIREASFDSTTSDLSLDLSLNGDIGVSTAEGLDTLCRGINKLIDNCENIDQDISCIPETKLPSSKSSMSGLNQYAASESGEEETAGDLKRDNSIPDLRALQRSLRQNKGMWKLTDFSGLSDRSRQASIVSDAGSFEWDSPVHGWTESRAAYRVPLAYSSNVSESGDEVASFAGSGLDAWEWDDCYTMEGENVNPVQCMSGHTSWLPDMSRELDMEAELRWRELSSGAASARSSLDRDIMMHYRRLPPSGRSSVDRESKCSMSSAASSEDLTITAHLPYKHRRSSEYNRSRTGSPARTRKRSIDYGVEMDKSSLMDKSTSSVDTGLGSMDTSVSSISSSMFVSSVNLSPVKEAGESPLRITELSSPTHRFEDSPEICLGDISTTDTVIKVSVPVLNTNHRSGNVAKSLFPGGVDGHHQQDNDVVLRSDVVNENGVAPGLDVRLPNNQSLN